MPSAVVSAGPRYAELPAVLSEEIRAAYAQMGKGIRQRLRRGGALQRHRRRPARRLFAGQQETFLHVRGDDLLLACRNCFASLFTNRAISYREDKGFDQLEGPCPSACRRWSVPTSLAPGSCSPSPPSRAFLTWC
ncbi:MAG: PEP/pyruvate-binding domain-containing protein [Syntrophotaleaceae bacterium]